jgi:hypothetical protein
MPDTRNDENESQLRKAGFPAFWIVPRALASGLMGPEICMETVPLLDVGRARGIIEGSAITTSNTYDS